MYRRANGSSVGTLLAIAWSSATLAQTQPAAAPSAVPQTADAEVEVDSATPAVSAASKLVPPTAGSSGTAPAQANVPSEPKAAAYQPSAAPATTPAQAATQTDAAKAEKHGTDVVATEPLVEVKGYAQLQFESHADSEDQLAQGGSLLNQNRFLVRRLRIELSRRYRYTGYLVELDGNTTSGPTLGLNRAEGAIFYAQHPGEPALVELTAGLLKLPFGYETPESSRARWFMERTTASKAFFPVEVDVGARLHGAWRFLCYGVAVTNGEPKGTKGTNFQLQDPNRAKDVTLRIGAETPASDGFQVAGGVSYLAGKGFRPGDDATKSKIVWSDSNENGIIDTGELTGVSGVAAVPATNFRRWAVGADLQTRLRTRLGWSSLFVEAVAAVNLDRGLFIASPTPSTPDMREFGWHVGFIQEVTRYAVVGFRYDSYNPDSDLLDSRGGKFLPNNQTIATYSPLVGVTLPDRARLVFQYDFIRDHLARDKSGVVTDFTNDQWTLRLQVNL